ncbi:hypothetical protein ABPG72_019803 [Tetrahymena utriculariae]
MLAEKNDENYIKKTLIQGILLDVEKNVFLIPTPMSIKQLIDIIIERSTIKQEEILIHYRIFDCEVMLQTEEDYVFFLQQHNRIKYPKIFAENKDVVVNTMKDEDNILLGSFLYKPSIDSNNIVSFQKINNDILQESQQVQNEQNDNGDIKEENKNENLVILKKLSIKIQDFQHFKKPLISSLESYIKKNEKDFTKFPVLKDENGIDYKCNRYNTSSKTVTFRCPKKICKASVTFHPDQLVEMFQINNGHQCVENKQQQQREFKSKMSEEDYQLVINYLSDEERILNSAQHAYEMIIKSNPTFKGSFDQISRIQEKIRNKKWPLQVTDKYLEGLTLNIDKDTKTFFIKKESIYISRKQQYVEGYYFGSMWGIGILTRALYVSFDLTFKSSPFGFKQIGTLLAFDPFIYSWLPVAYCILSSKDQQLYIGFFKSIIEKVSQTNKNPQQLEEKQLFKFTKVFTDFEINIHNSFTQITQQDTELFHVECLIEQLNKDQNIQQQEEEQQSQNIFNYFEMSEIKIRKINLKNFYLEKIQDLVKDQFQLSNLQNSNNEQETLLSNNSQGSHLQSLKIMDSNNQLEIQFKKDQRVSIVINNIKK